MATPPQHDFFRQNQSYSSYLTQCCDSGGGGDDDGDDGDDDDDDSNCKPSANNNILLFHDGRQQRPHGAEENRLKETEALLVSGLNQMSIQEQSEALEDVHCVRQDLQETPDMIQQSLAEFDQLVRATENVIYEKAVHKNRSYVEDSAFRLIFLRANLYDTGRSVRQMLNFLHQKAKHFGLDNITRDITIHDMNQADMVLVQSCMYHIQDSTDRNDRVILHVFNNVETSIIARVRDSLDAYCLLTIIIVRNLFRSFEQYAHCVLTKNAWHLILLFYRFESAITYQ